MSMLTREWTIVEGFSNADECCTTVLARKSNGEVEFAYFAYNGIKVVTVTGIDSIKAGEPDSELFAAIQYKAGDDWELGVRVNSTDNNLLLIDSNDELYGDDNEFSVTGSYVYESDEWDELDEEVIIKLGLL